MKRSPRTHVAEFDPVAKRIIVSRCAGKCEVDDCPHRGTQFHHRLRRSQGGLGTPENGLFVCDYHHGYIHAHPTESYLRGWLVRSS